MNAPILTTRDLSSLLERHAERFSILTDLLLEENEIHNLTRITDPPQIRLRHFLDSLIALKILDPMADSTVNFSCADIGSGAGFPVLPLAIVRPQWSFLSVEATGKKAAFQRRVCKTLGLSNVQVVSARAEELAHDRRYRGRFDAALARAVADLSIAAELSLGFVKTGGLLIAWKGPDVTEELQRAQKAFDPMGAADPESVPYVLGGEDTEPIAMALVVAEKNRPTPDRLPRSFAQIKHRPLSDFCI
jgi:16S rRNA (guanine527-N7)-methyltransferase